MFVDFVLIFGITVFSIIILMIIKKNSFSKNLLLIFLFTGLLNILYHAGIHHKIKWLEFITLFFAMGSGFYVAPFLYLYIKSFFVPKNIIVKKIFFHLIPYIIVWIIYVVPYNLSLYLQNFYYLTRIYNSSVRNIILFFIYFETFFFLFYTFKSLRALKKIKEKNKVFYSNSSYDLLWLKTLVYFLFIGSIISVIATTFFIQSPIEDGYYFNYVLITIFFNTILFLFLGYRGLYQSKVLLPEIYNEEKDYNVNNNHENKLEKQKGINYYPLSDEEIIQIKNQIDKLMNEEKIYKDSKLNLRDLALKCDISNQKLTSFINQNLETNFQSLINSYRIKEFKNRIKSGDSETYTLISIALDCGFNSKSSFNRVFKQFEGCTPTQFLNNKKNKDS